MVIVRVRVRVRVRAVQLLRVGVRPRIQVRVRVRLKVHHARAGQKAFVPLHLPQLGRRDIARLRVALGIGLGLGLGLGLGSLVGCPTRVRVISGVRVTSKIARLFRSKEDARARAWG